MTPYAERVRQLSQRRCCDVCTRIAKKHPAFFRKMRKARMRKEQARRNAKFEMGWSSK